MPELVRRFPSVTVIDVDAVLLQVRAVMDRVAQALMWVFVFALSAGVLVLAAAIQSTQRERVLDSVLLKTLGAPRAFIQRTLLIEFALLGAVAGIVGTIGALVTAWLLADQVLHIPYRPSLTDARGGYLLRDRVVERDRRYRRRRYLAPIRRQCVAGSCLSARWDLRLFQTFVCRFAPRRADHRDETQRSARRHFRSTARHRRE